jgi:FAD/FMN-containing dehydrogenase
MKRREVLKASLPATLLAGGIPGLAQAAARALQPGSTAWSRVRPGGTGWPRAAEWEQLRRATSGRLQKLASPFAACAADAGADGAACAALREQIKNPFFIGDHPALTQTSGWQDAWLSQPSAYAVAARETADIVAAVNFARTHRLRLVVKGGGHSYKGASNAPDSLLVWTRAMNAITLHDAFVPQGAVGPNAQAEALPAVSIGAGAMWIDAYTFVTTRAGRYVQGGGCTTVGVPGLVQGGGFGNFSKRYGTAASSLLEAEIVTADGAVRIANAHTHPDLFWAIKGGGGGTFGVVTRMTLRTHELPEFFGGVFGEITAASSEAFKALVARFIAFYRERLFNPHWGETVSLRDGRQLHLSMVFQGLDRAQAQAAWAPFLDWVRASGDYTFKEPTIMAVPARQFWDAASWDKTAPGIMTKDGREGAPAHHAAWTGDREQAGWHIHGYESAWLPAGLLEDGAQARLVDSLCAAAQQWWVELHFNKGLAGAPREALAAARDTATHPGVVDAFALAIIAGGGDPAFPGMPGAQVDQQKARRRAAAIRGAMDTLRKAAPGAGAYISESDYFQERWQDTYWGPNYPKLLKVKGRYDPDGLFTVRHGVGSEQWSVDGFTREG